MDYKYFILFAGFFFSLLAAFAVYSWLSRSYRFSEIRTNLIAGWIPVLLVLLSVIPLLFYAPAFYDFVGNITPLAFLWPLLAAAGGGLVILLFNERWIRLAAALILISAAVLFTPALTIVFYAGFPLWLNKIFTVLLWLACTFSLRLLGGINGLAVMETAAVSFGLLLVAVIGGAPLLLGYSAFAFTGGTLALLVYNWYPARLQLSAAAYDILGLFLGWLVISFAAEGSGASAYILCLYLIIETAWAVLKKLTFLKAFADIKTNPVYYQSNISGLHPVLIANHINRNNIVLILFACFQVFAPNSYSLPLLCTIIVLWNVYRLYYWQNQPKNLSEINREFVDEFKTGLNNVKKNLQRKE